MPALLDGIRVIDCASFIAGPVAATILADFGADVIKIEPPPHGDAYRHIVDAPGNPACEENYAWTVDNRNKRSLALDLKEAAGREVLHRMVRQADVFVTNTPLPARAHLGIQYEKLASLNERLVYASLTAYGEQGREAGHTGFDSTALWARSSLMDMVRAAPDAEPVRSLPGMGDHPTAVSLYAAIMTALFRRERTGRGTYVHTSLLANGVFWNGIQVQAMLCGAEFERRPARTDATSALHNLYETRDGRWFHLVLIPEDKRWGPFLEAIERPALASDTRFRDSTSRRKNARALIATLDEVFRMRTWPDWRARLERHGITYGLVGTLRDIPGDEQMRATGIITPMPTGPDQSAEWTVNSPLWIEDEPKPMPRRAPAVGEHSEEILAETGLSSPEIASLKDRGVIV